MNAEPVGKNDWQFKFLCHIYMGFDNKISSLPKLFLAYSWPPIYSLRPLILWILSHSLSSTDKPDIAPTLLALSYLGPPYALAISHSTTQTTAHCSYPTLGAQGVHCSLSYRSRLSATVTPETVERYEGDAETTWSSLSKKEVGGRFRVMNGPGAVSPRL